MPTYCVTTINERFSPEQKNQLAKALTEINCSITGAPRYLVQVIFKDVPSADYFVGGKPMMFDTILVQGYIRSGIKIEIKKKLIAEVMHFVASIGETDKSAVQVYIIDLPASQIAEWGRFLPQPGLETSWDAGFSEEIRKRIDVIGK